MTVRLQLLAARFAAEREQNPDVVITGKWGDPGLWSIGAPAPLAPPSRRTTAVVNARIAASSRRPTRACTRVPSGSASALQHLGVAVEHRDQVLAVPGDERVHVDGRRRERSRRSPRANRLPPRRSRPRTATEPGIPAGEARASRARHQVDLVQHQHLGHVARADLLQHACGRPRSGRPAPARPRRPRARSCPTNVTSSSVERNASTRSCGSFATNPTVSDSVATRRRPGARSGGSSGSSVANSWSATITSAPVSRRSSVDLPAFV